MTKKNIIKEKTFEFAISIIKLTRKLKQNRDFVLADQLLRSWTSIGANIEEAIGGASKKDFISKVIIAHKEARETKYWLRLIEADNPSLGIENYMKEINDIVNITSKIIITSRNNLN